MANLEVSLAGLEDAPTLALIHRLGYGDGTGSLYTAAYSNCSASALDASATAMYASDIQNPLKAVYKATVGGRLMAFATWDLPVDRDAEPLPESKPKMKEDFPEGANFEVVGYYFDQRVRDRMKDAELRRPHYRLSSVACHPEAQRKGLAEALLVRGLEIADAKGLPTYLDATGISAPPLYEKLGFKKWASSLWVHVPNEEIEVLRLMRPPHLRRP